MDYFYIEKESGASLNNRKVTQELLDTFRFDDVLVVTELNRLINNLIIEIYKYMAESKRLKIKERHKCKG
ncbi:recombinase family protein [Finegoldia magna]|uniref:recombinase family protein n=1 Tax=Finegoldia magna TaxID=1260 RepID=UPI00132852DC|nr:hypothetical protein [Finegoldia magna]MSD45352.1 hypothetical protein [Finegoldia magna]